jgi:hypothetical protein
MARVARAASVGHHKITSISSFETGQSRWVDQGEGELGSSISAWMPRVPDPAYAPRLSTRQQPPVKAPLAPPPRAQAAPALGYDIPVKPPPAKPYPEPRIAVVASGGTPTPLAPAAPQPRSTWIAPQTVARGGWHASGSAWAGNDTPPQGPGMWGTTSATALTRSGAPHYWEPGRPAGWKMIMGDLPANVTSDMVRACVCSKHYL